MMLSTANAAAADIRTGRHVVAIGGEFNKPATYPPDRPCTARVRRIATGEVVERFTVDVRELLASGEYVRA
jgi:hypothetical protein